MSSSDQNYESTNPVFTNIFQLKKKKLQLAEKKIVSNIGEKGISKRFVDS